MVHENKCQNKVTRDKILQQDDIYLKRFLDVGILEEIAKKSSNKETSASQIRFRYERFYDYYFSPLLREKASQDISLDCQEVTTAFDRLTASGG